MYRQDFVPISSAKIIKLADIGKFYGGFHCRFPCWSTDKSVVFKKI